MPLIYDTINQRATGGTELMMKGLEQRIEPGLLDDFYISRNLTLLKSLPEDKIKVLWTHEYPRPYEYDKSYFHEMKFMTWHKLHHMIAVSYFQLHEYIHMYDFREKDWTHMSVMKNALDPIAVHNKPSGPIRLIHTSSPNRGLRVLYHAFEKLSPKYPEIELEIYGGFSASFDLSIKQDHEELLKMVSNHPKIIYHGRRSNQEVRQALQRCHIFAYPATYPETSCLALLEAMSAKLLCVHSDVPALHETGAGLTNMYHFEKNGPLHVERYEQFLEQSIQQYLNGDIEHLDLQKQYVDKVYSWQTRIAEWKNLLINLKKYYKI